MVAEAAGLSLLFIQTSWRVLLPWERGATWHTVWDTISKNVHIPQPSGILWPGHCHSRAILMHKHSEGERSPFFSWWLLGQGLSWGNGKFAYETFSSLAGGYTPSSLTPQEVSPARWLLVLPRCPPLWQQGSSSFCKGEISFGGGRTGVSNSHCLFSQVAVYSQMNKCFLDQQLNPRFPFSRVDCPNHCVFLFSFFFFS